MSRKHFCLQLNSFFRETGTCPHVSLKVVGDIYGVAGGGEGYFRT